MSKRRRPRSITKAAPQFAVGKVPATTFTLEQVNALMRRPSPLDETFTPLPREPQALFGPGIPVQPAPLDQVDPITGRPQPRIWEYPVSSNLPGVTDRLIPWKVLREAAEAPLVRDCIRIRKNMIASLGWDIVVSKRALQQYKKMSPDTSSVSIQKQLRTKLNPDTARLLEFWEKPDFEQGETFVEWAGKILEEHLVLDAVALYPFKSRGGDRQGFRVLDGSTIKVLLNKQGGRPMPPFPAYQQVLWGFPRGEWEADTDVDGAIPGGYDSDRLVYRRREVRTFTPYGFSVVEQALQDIDLYLRRLDWDKAQYTDGVQPAGWIKNTGMDTWTVPQLTNYNQAFNELYAGQTLSRQRYHLLPPGMEPVESKDHPEKFKPDYHLHLIKLVAMHFDMTVAELGFTEAKGLGSAGYHEGQADVQERKATNPDLRWLQAVLTEISRTHLGMPPELEFVFLGLDSEDEQAADEVFAKQVHSGGITVNEWREEMGRAPFDFKEADMPLVETNRGILFLQNASQTALPGELIQPSQQTDTERESEQSAGQDPATETGTATKAAYGSGDQRAERVTQQLTHDFPNGSLEWARDAKWEGPVQVPLSRLDFSNTDHWVVDPEKISGAQDRIQAGWTKPVILVQTPHRKHFTVVDGHHRSLAYRRLNQPVMAWIGRVNWDSGPWDLLHAKAADPELVKTELAAYSKWRKNGTSTRRPFTFQHLSRADAASHEIDLERVVFAE